MRLRHVVWIGTFLTALAGAHAIGPLITQAQADVAPSVIPDEPHKALRYIDDKDITLEYEVLTLDETHTSVFYRFHNKAGVTKRLNIAFPMPLHTVRPEGTDAFLAATYKEYGKCQPEYLCEQSSASALTPEKFNFQVRQTNPSTGQLQSFTPAVKKSAIAHYYDRGRYTRDVTEAVVAAGLKPDSSRILKSSTDGELLGSAPWKELNAKAPFQEWKLKDDTYYVPAWDLQTEYHWQMTLAAGKKLEVEHRYVTPYQWFNNHPLDRATVGLGPSLLASHQGNAAKAYGAMCGDFSAEGTPGREFIAQANALSEDYVSTGRRYDYVLRTGGKWSGPIGKLIVRIKPERDHIAVLCLDKEMFLIPKEGRDISLTDYEPTGDVRLYFLRTLSVTEQEKVQQYLADKKQGGAGSHSPPTSNAATPDLAAPSILPPAPAAAQ